MNPIERGTMISTIAAVLILLTLILINYSGIESITKPEILILLYALFFLAIIAFKEYNKLEMPFYRIFKISISIGLSIVFIGLLLLSFNIFEGAYLIVLGYFSEPIGGIAPFSIYMKINNALGKLTYISGAIYVFSLPLLILNLGIIPIIANSIKLAGFLALTYQISNQELKIRLLIKERI